MNKLLKVVLALMICFSIVGCGSSEETKTNQSEEETQDVVYAEKNEEETIEDDAWDQLEALGKVETENGVFTVSITFPADFVSEDITQESLDKDAGETYISAKLNGDGSVTYKMTKKQHKAMLDAMVQSLDDGLQEMVDSSDYSFSEITHNKDFTQFDVKVEGNELGFGDSFAVIGFYIYGGMYGIFSGKEPENVVVNFYSPNGDLITTANSDDMGN